MVTQIKLGDIAVDVVKKDIKHVYLSVHPPAGRVRISAPRRMDMDAIRAFAIAKLGWIKRQQRRLREQARETPREYLERESHFAWGRRYLLQVIEKDAPPRVQLSHGKMILQVRPGSSEATRRAVIAAWYREQLLQAILPLIAKWESLLGVRVAAFTVRQMKTRWGSCTPSRKTIRLNLELAKKPPACLEYVVVHEMVHLLEPTHNSRFVALMDRFLPNWQFHRAELNRLPIRHETWTY